ncbi:MAG: carbohydrate kinase family protein [Pseudomonadota bacterium]
MSASRGPVLLCVGDIDMDLVVRVARPPGPDEKVDGRHVARTPGGMAANVAVGASRLGTPVRLVGAVGDDAMGREALDALRAEGINLDHVVKRAGTATFFCVIMVDDRGEKSLVKVLSDAYLPRPDDITASVFEGVAHVHLTFTEPALADRVVALAKAAGATLSLDLEAADLPDDRTALAGLIGSMDLLFISRQSRVEVERLMGELPLRDGRTLVTTLGEDGARLEKGSEVLAVPGHQVGVLDTSGAGDAFAAAFLHARLGGAPDGDALRFANAAAALSTSQFGAQAGLPTRAETLRLLEAGTRETRRA